jgi:excisionase family DNA binding protein
MSGPLVTLAQAASTLGVSSSTMRRWADGERISSVRTKGGHRRFPLSEVRRMSAEVSGTRVPVLRKVALPAQPLTKLAELFNMRADSWLELASRALYDANGTGWFGAATSQEALHDWMGALADSARDADWAPALEATRRMLGQAHRGGTSLVERYGFLERFSDVALRTMQKESSDRESVLDARRLYWNILRLALAEPGAA